MSIDVDVTDGIATITINRPERMNAMDADHYKGLSQAWMRVRDDAAIRVAIITGAGDKSFSAGADLKSFITAPAGLDEMWLTQRDQLLNRGLEVWKPVIAAVNGYCLAGGMTLLLGTDIRIAAEHATFNIAEVKRGILPGNGGTQRILDQLPYAIGMELLLTGDSIDAQKALHYGLINKVVPKDKLMDDGARDGEEDRRERAARRAGRQGNGGALARDGPHDGLALRGGDQPHAAVHRGRQGGAEGLRREARSGLQGPLTMASPYPLAGIKVVDLSQIYNGPYATFLMAQAGADVIKVEPKGGEHLRRRGVVGGAALPFAMLNANKRSVSLDLKNPQGRDLLIDMVRRADVLVENFAPGVVERLGLGVEAMHKVNPRLVYAQSSGYGQDGPLPRLSRDGPDRAGDVRDHGHHGLSGTRAGEGRPCAVRLLRRRASLWRHRHRAARPRAHRARTCRRGCDARFGLCVARFNARHVVRHRLGGRGPHRQPARRPRGIALQRLSGERRLHRDHLRRRAALEKPARCHGPRRAWRRSAFREPEDARRPHGRHRRSREQLHKANHQAGSVRALDEAPRAMRAGAHAERSGERSSSASARHAAMDRSPELGRIVVQSSPMRYDGTPQLPHQPSRRLGEDNEGVLGGWLGLSRDEVARLAKEGVI